VNRGTGRIKLAIQRLFPAQDEQAVGGIDHCAADEQRVDALRVLNRLAQAPPRKQIQSQGAGAEVEIEIDKRGLQAELFGQRPGSADRDRAGADATANAGYDGGATAFRLRFFAADIGWIPAQRIDQQFIRDRLDQVVDGTCRQDAAVERNIVLGSDCDHLFSRPLNQVGDIADRVGRRRHIDDDRVGVELDLFQGLGDAAGHHLGRLQQAAIHQATKHVARVRIVRERLNAPGDLVGLDRIDFRVHCYSPPPDPLVLFWIT